MSSTSSTTAATTAIQGYLNTAQTLSALTGTSTDAPAATLTGLVSGINTTQIISELMTQAAQPQTALQTQLTTVNNTLTDWSSLSADATQLQQAADQISQPSQWADYTAASSSSGVTATAGTGAVGGSLTFTVDQLATSGALVSAGTVSSLNQQVTAAPSLLLSQGGSAVGLGGLTGTLGLGAHTIAVTTASAGASVTGSAPPAASTTVTAGSNDTLDYTLDGVASTLTLAPGADLTAAQLAAEVQSASGGALTAGYDSSGAMVLATTAQGSSQTLQVTGGNALATLGLTAGTSGTGQDGVVTVDGTATSVGDVTAGGTVTLNAPGGSTIQAAITGPLTLGSITANEISTGNGSLTDVVQGVNNADVGVTASEIQVGNGQYRLELTSNATGAASDVDVSAGALEGIGGTSVLTAGADAQLTVGTGPGAFAVSSASNTVTGLMPGVSLQLNTAAPTTPVTVSLTPDASAAAAQVSTLVNAANAMITDLNTAMTLPASSTGSSTSGTSGSSSTSSSSSSTSTANALEGLLLGDPTADGVLSSLLSAVSGQAGANSSGSAGIVGITMGSNGTLTFDQSTFEAAYTANPTQVANTFTQGATSTSPLMSMYEATDNTQAGSYQVAVTQAATQGNVTGSVVAGGAIAGPETISLQAQGATASYQASTGESLADIAAGINTATANAGVGVEAAVVNGALSLTSVAYGSGGSFQVESSATGAGSTGLASSADTWQTYTGQDVAGTIDGQAATGTGQLLLGGLGTPSQGLIVQVNATPAQLAAAGTSSLGTINYTPGIAQALASAALTAVNPAGGSIVNAISGLQTEATDLSTQIANWNPILQQKQQQLQQEYTAMETALAGLDSTKSQLTQSFSSSSTGS